MYTSQLVVSQNELNLYNIESYSFNKEGIEVDCHNANALIWAISANFNIKLNTELDESRFISNKSKHQQHQRVAVRLLLYKLISSIPKLSKLKDISLDESSFPYRLKPNGYYVSFTHSKNKIACAICTSQSIGIDTELSFVPTQTAKRFYNSNEIMWIRELDNKDKQFALNLLWMLKEAIIKRNSNNNLVIGLSSDLTNIAKNLLRLKNKRGENKIEKTSSVNHSRVSTLRLDSNLYILIHLSNNAMVLVI